MSVTPLDMRRAALIRQDEAAQSRVPPDRSEFGRNRSMMTHTALGDTALSPDVAARTAQAWYEQAASMAATAVKVSDMAASLAEAADKLLNTASVTQQLEPAVFPSNVYHLDDYRTQAVQR